MQCVLYCTCGLQVAQATVVAAELPPLLQRLRRDKTKNGNDMCEEREKRELVPKQKMEANCLEGAVVFLEWDVRVLYQSDLFVLHFKPDPCHDKP